LIFQYQPQQLVLKEWVADSIGAAFIQ